MSKALHALLFVVVAFAVIPLAHAQQPALEPGQPFSIAGQWHWRADCGLGGAWHGSFQFEEPSKNQFKGLVTANIAEPGMAAQIGACPTPIRVRNGRLTGHRVSFVKESCGGARPQPWKGTIVRGSDGLLHMSGTAVADSSKLVPLVRDWQCAWTASQSRTETVHVSAQGQPDGGAAIPPRVAEAPALPRQAQVVGASDAAGLYALENEITFNVLDHVEIEAKTGKLILMGHSDAAYATQRIPYLQYLATLLDNPAPEFSLEWTRASEARIADLRRRLNTDDEWRRLAGEWGRWIDDSERITPAGRFFMPLFGITVPAGPHMDRYQVLTGVFHAIGEQQAADILNAFGEMHRAMPNLTIQHLYRLFRAAGVFDIFVDARSEMQSGRMTEQQVRIKVYRALFANFDRALNYSGNPTSRAFENALRRGLSPDGAMEAAIGEFDRQFTAVYGDALRKLYRSKREIDVPITLVNQSLKDILNVEPKYIGLNSSTLLAKLLLNADRTAKSIINMPELAAKIPGYETEYDFKMKNGLFQRSNRVRTARLWISVERVDASQSSDGGILVFGETKMRFNIREIGQAGRDVPGQQATEYEKLLTSLYDGFARQYSPTFHELREAAKLAYVAQWLKARNPAFRLPPEGLANWQGPRTVPGVIFVTWSPDPSRLDVQTVSAIGGVSLRVPPPGPGTCVKFCEDQIRKDSRIRSVAALPQSALTDLVLKAKGRAESFGNIVGIYLSNFHNPFEAYASAEPIENPSPRTRINVQQLPPDTKKNCLRYGSVKREGVFWQMPIQNVCYSTAITAHACSYPDGGEAAPVPVGSGLLGPAAVYEAAANAPSSGGPSIRLPNGAVAAVLPTEGQMGGSVVAKRLNYTGPAVLRSPDQPVRVEIAPGLYKDFALGEVTFTFPDKPNPLPCPPQPLPLCSESDACMAVLRQRGTQ